MSPLPAKARRAKRKGKMHVNSTKHELDGFKFDSGVERDRYVHLKRLADAGLISELEPHPTWQLFVNDRPVLTPKTKRNAKITLDFRYMDHRGETPRLVHEDVKGRATDLALFRISVWEAMTGYECVIVTRANQ